VLLFDTASKDTPLSRCHQASSLMLRSHASAGRLFQNLHSFSHKKAQNTQRIFR